MPLFQTSVLKKYLKGIDPTEVTKAYDKFTEYFHNEEIQQNIRDSKEEQFQEGFLRELFVNVFGYTLNPKPSFNLTTEFKNEVGAKKADGAIVKNDKAIGVIELKSTKTIDLESIRQQAFDYKANQSECIYVITSNFEKLRFYIDNAVEFEEFDLFTIDRERFNLLYLCLQKDQLLNDKPLKAKQDSLVKEENVTKKLYSDYSEFKNELYDDIVNNNLDNSELSELEENEARLKLFKKTQKLMDRFLFIFFSEDRGLIPPNTISTILTEWTKLKELDAYSPLYDRFKKHFEYINTGWKGQNYEIFAYNGGLFQEDKILDTIVIDDDILYRHTKKLTAYDFETEVDVNILGHIFEHSLNEIENINAKLEGKEVDTKKTKRKKDGVFYTPKYITKYIVDNTVGKLCEEKKVELEIVEEEYSKGKSEIKKLKKKRKTDKRDEQIELETERINNKEEKLEEYRNWLLNITICDPACGSGAFLNQALDFLITEHRWIDEMRAKLFEEGMVFQDVENSILEKNLYGVDINEESVEIAKLSLWLRTAKKGRKLTSLNNNIKCGNSLIDDPEVAGDKAFKWEEEFPEIFKKGGFDVVIGNPPYLRMQGLIDAYPKLVEYYSEKYESATGNYDIYVLFSEKSYFLINDNGISSFIMPHKFLISEFGEGLRKFLSERKAVKSILHFKEHMVFEVTTYTCIIILDKSEKKDLLFAHTNPFKITQVLKFEEMRQSELGISNWNLMSKQKSDLFIKLNNLPYKLKDKFSKVFVGLQTSADKIYLIKGKVDGDFVIGYSKSLDRIVKIEKGLLKPQLKGQDVYRYKSLENEYYVIFPYVIKSDNKYENMTEDYIKNNFPLGFKYLKDNEDEIRGREKGRMDIKEGWFLYIYPKSITQFEQPKIITPEISLGTNMSYDEDNLYHNTKCYSFILKEKSITNYKYYLTILNSKVMWFYLINTGYVLRGGYFTFKTKYLFPFPLPEEPANKELYAEKADKMLQLNKDLQKTIDNLLKYIQSDYPMEKPSTKLQNWHELDFSEFKKELKKNINKENRRRRKSDEKELPSLTKSEEMEWMELFETKRAEAQKLVDEIDKTDNEIDKLVYKLYDLTYEEIKIVDPETDITEEEWG